MSISFAKSNVNYPLFSVIPITKRPLSKFFKKTIVYAVIETYKFYDGVNLGNWDGDWFEGQRELQYFYCPTEAALAAKRLETINDFYNK